MRAIIERTLVSLLPIIRPTLIIAIQKHDDDEPSGCYILGTAREFLARPTFRRLQYALRQAECVIFERTCVQFARSMRFQITPSNAFKTCEL